MKEQLKLCPICNFSNIQLYHSKVWSLDNGEVFQCQKCDLLFLGSIMSEEEEVAFYKNYGEHLVARGGIQPTDNPQELYKMMLPAAQERLNYIKDFFQTSTNVLEIGASAGSFLGALIDFGLSSKNLTSVEPSIRHRQYMQKSLEIEVYEDIGLLPENKKYDVVCMFHVLEHISTPKVFLERIKNFLKGNGTLIIEVPSHTDALLKLYHLEEFKDFYFQPMHPYVYSPQSLENVLVNSGFHLDEIIFYQRYGLDNHLNWLTYKIPGGNQTYHNIVQGEADNSYKKAIERAHLSDTIFAIAHI